MKLNLKENAFDALQEKYDNTQQALAVKNAENQSLRLLGGGFNVDAQCSAVKEEDCSVGIDKLRDMMIRSKASKASHHDKNIPQIAFGTPVQSSRKISVLYGNADELPGKKKLTIRELVKTKKSILPNRKLVSTLSIFIDNHIHVFQRV